MALPSDADLLKKVRGTVFWQRNARFLRPQYPWDLYRGIQSALTELRVPEQVSLIEYVCATGRVFNLARSQRAQKAGRTRSTKAKARKKARERELTEPKFLF